LATWLARRLSLAGFRTWCHETAPLAGENADETVRKLLDTRARHYLPVISTFSLSNEKFLERCTIAAAKEESVLPCSLIDDSEARMPSRVSTLVPANFKSSWNIG